MRWAPFPRLRRFLVRARAREEADHDYDAMFAAMRPQRIGPAAARDGIPSGVLMNDTRAVRVPITRDTLRLLLEHGAVEIVPGLIVEAGPDLRPKKPDPFDEMRV